jgi:hypothetical protein
MLLWLVELQNPILTKPLRSADFRFLNMFGRKIRHKSALGSDILFASTEVMNRP